MQDELKVLDRSLLLKSRELDAANRSLANLETAKSAARTGPKARDKELAEAKATS
jgi:hypothetical protein